MSDLATTAPAPAAARPSRWHDVPLMWLVLGIPALTVVAGLSTIVIANVGGDVVVRDDFRKEGLAINRDPRRDAEAARLGVAARVGQDGPRLVAALAPGRAEPPRRLVAVLSHATRAEHDRMVTLERTAAGVYVAEVGELPRGHWYLELTPTDREWRLTGDFVDRAGALTLTPTG
ncbi:MAG: FixH family protein [Steroidobacteraceae bacterium]|jgi:hypothetical protein|nr:FixH family protein [Steroidobacteraceae bacterium]